MSRAATEVELKLSVRDARQAGDVARALGVPEKPAPAAERVHDVYYDTEDRALLAAGYGFRVRERPDGRFEATLKEFASADGQGVSSREEKTEPLPGARPDRNLLPDGALRDTLDAAAGDRPLLPLARVAGTRRRTKLEPEEGLRVEVVHDRVRLTCGKASVSDQEVEVELLAGSRTAFDTWVRARLARLRVRASAGSKLERALRAARVRVPPAGRVAAARLALGPRAGASTPTSTAAAQALGRLALELARAFDAARRGAVEGVHDVRTVARRLRGAMSAYRDELPDGDRKELRRRLAHLRRAAGSVRDLDIVREALSSASPDIDDRGLAALKEALALRRRRERSDLSDALASGRLAVIADRVAAIAAHVRAHGGPPLAVAGASRLPRAMEDVFARRAAIHGPLEGAEPNALHALRIAAKKARYAAETFASAFGGTVERFGRAAKALQDELGIVQDARSIAAALREVVAVVPTTGRRRDAAARAAVALVERGAKQAKKARRRIDAVADALLSPKSLRELFDHLAKRSASVLREVAR